MKRLRGWLVEIGLQIVMALVGLGLTFLLVGIFERLGGSVGP